MRPVQPGEILLEVVEAAGVSEREFSNAFDVLLERLSLVLEGRQGTTGDMASRLARSVGTPPQLWLRPRQTWELRRAEIEAGRQMTRRVTPYQTAA